MRVPLSWLADFVDLRVEPARLAEDLTLAGLAVDAIEQHGSERVLELDITTNRVDCMNVYGVAREVATLYGLPLRPPACDFVEQGPPAEAGLRVAIQAPELCGRFTARVLDVRIERSPAWLERRLELAGVRPISNVVDLTNYVLLELGQPSHAFDLDRIPGACLAARWGQAGETLVTLDGQARALDERSGVVAGGDGGALALAGIMGGASSEVGAATLRVVLEAAWWEPQAVRRTARRLALHTDASHRFERGADFEGPPAALARIAHLLTRLGAGSVRPGAIDVVARPRTARRLRLRDAQVERLLGSREPLERAGVVLAGLGFAERERDAEGASYEVPSWRHDVTREVDLVEEVARHHGLTRLPSRLPPVARLAGLNPAQQRERRLRRVLSAAGFQEVVNYAFVPARKPGQAEVPGRDSAAAPAPWALANPLSEELGVLRTSLVFPGLLMALGANLRQGRRDVALYEIGRVYLAQDGGWREELRLAVLLAGARPRHWSRAPRPADLFDVSGLLAALCSELGLPEPELVAEDTPQALQAGRAAWVQQQGARLGWLGALAPALARAWECRDETLVAEVALSDWLEVRPPAVRVQALPRYPAVERDLSLVCPDGTSAASVAACVRAAAGPLLRDVEFADRYVGSPLAAGRYGLTLALRFQDARRTLTGEEVQAAVDAATRALRGLGLEIRGE